MSKIGVGPREREGADLDGDRFAMDVEITFELNWLVV